MASDGEYEVSGAVTVTVTNINDKPVLNDDKVATYLNQDVTIDVLANDKDIETSKLKIAAVIKPDNGIANIVENKIVYQPEEGYVGTDTITYTVNDNGLKVSATVTITVEYPKFYDEGTVIVHPIPGGDGGAGGSTTDTPSTPPAKPVVKVTSEPKKRAV